MIASAAATTPPTARYAADNDPVDMDVSGSNETRPLAGARPFNVSTYDGACT
jgi:hypothetical protein